MRDTTGDLASAGVHLTLTLPAEVPPIPVYRVGDQWTADVSGEFEYWDELAGGGSWQKVRFRPSGGSEGSDFLTYLTSGKNVLAQDGKNYTLRSTMTVRTEVRYGPEYGVDPLTGRKLSLPQLKQLREYLASLSDSSSSGGLRHGVSDPAKDFIARDGMKRTISPEGGDSKPLQGSAGTKPQGGSTPPEPARPPKPPPAPPPPPPPINPRDPPSGYRSVVRGGGNFSGRVFQWNSKVGAWVSALPVRSYPSVSDLAKDAEASLSRGSKSFPRGSSVRVTADGYIYVTPP